MQHSCLHPPVTAREDRLSEMVMLTQGSEEKPRGVSFTDWQREAGGIQHETEGS